MTNLSLGNSHWRLIILQKYIVMVDGCCQTNALNIKNYYYYECNL